MKLHDLEQGSQEWLDFRKDKIGASSAPVIMGESPYKRTQLMLWKEMVGLSQPPQATPAMARGNALEEQVRQLLKEQYDLEVSPAVGTHDTKEYMLASYDGLSSCGKIAVEIKCVKREFHDIAVSGKVPQGFYAQVQHQIYVGNIEKMFYVSYSPNHEENDKKLIVLPVSRDEEYIANMLKAEQKFWDCFVNLIPPDSVDLDYVSRSDDQWCTVASNVMVYAEKANQFKELYEFEKQKLIQLSNGANTLGGGVKLTRYVTKGRVQYNKIPELKGIDLDGYRSKESESFRITTTKNDSISNGSF